MKREIKFKIWCEFEIDGVIHKSMESPASWFLISQTGQLWSYGPMQSPRPIRDNYKVVIPLQFTGLKDKNGKEIYEGDILEVDGYVGSTLHEVKWGGVYPAFEIEPNPFDDCNGLQYVASVSDDFKCEVLGNIYETPELLK